MAETADAGIRIAALERALARQKTVARELEQIVEDKTRELFLAMDRIKRQARLVGARTALGLLAEYGTLERAAPRMLEAFGQELDWHVVRLWMTDADGELRCVVDWKTPGVEHRDQARTVLAEHTWLAKKPTWLDDIATQNAGCAFPILVDSASHAVIEMIAMEPRVPDEDLLVTLSALGTQIGQFIERAKTQEQLRARELQIAKQIQTAILPRDLGVANLEVAATMVPAADVGGDYFDVLPFAGGAWLGIGDVTGHGVVAGMIMMMVQSAVAALTRDTRRVSPSDLVIALNEMLHDNIRGRLRETDHVTFSLLRYTADGRVRFSGAHEDLIVWRARTKSCELIPTEGAWIGMARSIAGYTFEHELALEPGDVLLLYTDGLTEARNARHQQFGIERVCDRLAALAPTASASAICSALVGEAQRWATTQDDDISVVACRYKSP